MDIPHFISSSETETEREREREGGGEKKGENEEDCIVNRFENFSDEERGASLPPKVKDGEKEDI